MAEKINFLQVRFDRMPPEEATQVILMRLISRRGGRICYANAHTMVTASRSPELVHALEHSDLVLADGSGVRWGSALLGAPLTYNLNGTDLVPALCQAGKDYGLSVYLLGGKPGVAEDAATNLKKAYPELIIAGIQHGYYAPEETPQILENIRAAKPHLLLVAMGVPLQELWLEQYADQLPEITCMGVGGLLDFLANRVPRAPRLVRAIGMEWSWRLLMEPGRLWKRYLVGNLVFLGLLFSYITTARSVNQKVTYKYGDIEEALSAVFNNSNQLDTALLADDQQRSVA